MSTQPIAHFEAARLAAFQRFTETAAIDTLQAELTEATDALLRAFWNMPAEETQGIALVALGGYGRGKFYPYSDIDVMVLYEPHAKARAEGFASKAFYPLWDAKLTLGQAVRSVEEALALAESDITVRTSMLDMRLVAGDAVLAETFQQRFWAEVITPNVQGFVEAKLAERDRRHVRFGASRYQLEPNVKEGKGGLRDVHTLWWLMRAMYGVNDWAEVESRGLLGEEEGRKLHQAREFLARARTHLHLQAGMAEDRLSFDRQPMIASAMGFRGKTEEDVTTRFMRRYFAAARRVGASTRVLCALLEASQVRPPKRPFGWFRERRLAPFTLMGERLGIKNTELFASEPTLMIELFVVAQREELDIHPSALQAVEKFRLKIDHTVRSTPEASALFLEVLLARKGAETTLRRMSEAGVLGALIPDFARIIGQTQFNRYHLYTVDEHTLMAIGTLHAIENGELSTDLPLASELISRISMRRVLYLALFCHDIAKGRNRDHSEAGEEIVRKLATRFAFTDEEIETCAWLVREHLLFSHTAFKRDSNDPSTIRNLVAEVQSSERLKLLFVLTVADIRSVGPHVWNQWKAALLRDVYGRAEALMGTGPVAIARHHAHALRDGLIALLPDLGERVVDLYLEQGSASFFASYDLPKHAQLVRMLHARSMMTYPLMIDVQHDYERMISEVTICAPDQYGLFSQLTAALSLSGASIINAKIATLKDGTAVDVFHVQAAGGDVFDRPDRMAKLSVYVEQLLSGTLSVREALAARPFARLPHRAALWSQGQVFFDNEASAVCTVVEIAAPDRAGLLCDISAALTELRLSIVSAQITTYGAQAIDVFYIKDVFGLKITHEGKLNHIRSVLLTAVKAHEPA